MSLSLFTPNTHTTNEAKSPLTSTSMTFRLLKEPLLFGYCISFRITFSLISVIIILMSKYKVLKIHF